MPVVFSNYSPAIPPPPPSGIEAGDIHVATTGNDTTGDGSIELPYATLQKAHDVAVAGNLIYVRGGTYTLTSTQTFTTDGNSGNRIRLFAYPGESPVIDGINLTGTSRAIILNSAHWWHIKGFEVKNAAGTGINLQNASSNNIIENNNVHHNVRLAANGSGIEVGSSADPTAADNLILNNDCHHQSYQLGGSGGDGIGVVYTKGTGNIVRGNRMWRNQDDGLDLWNSRYVLVEDNWAWENGYDDDLVPTSGNGNGFKLGGDDTTDGNHTIRRNLSWRNKQTGFDENEADLTMDVFNNTAYENTGNGFQFNKAVAYVLRNNLCLNDAVNLNAAVDDTDNSWNTPPGVTVTSADFLSTDFTANTGSRQSDGSLPESDFLKLASGSDCINAGTDVGLSYLGAAPDLGAYERE